MESRLHGALTLL